MKEIIDADNMKIIGYFDEEDTEKEIAEFEETGKWNDVSVDQSGDIILWKE